jgi:YfiH family protein
MAVRPVFLTQVHGVGVAELGPHTPDGTVADACLSTQAGLACCIMVADCLPVLFTTLSGRVVAAAHAGWRGLAGQGGLGILETTVQKLCASAEIQTLAQRAEIIAWLGPCIGPTAFEVGPEVYAAFVADQPQAQSCFTALPEGKWLADLAGLARLRLAALGITQVYGNNSSAAWCTVGNASRFYSFRRDRVTGRQAACIWRV